MFIPYGFHEMRPQAKAKICNGCGSKGGIDVPDTMYGLSVTKSCDIHDFMWYYAKSIDDLHEANDIFYDNMKSEIKNGSWWFRGVRYIRAHTYYRAVSLIGTESYARERGF